MRTLIAIIAFTVFSSPVLAYTTVPTYHDKSREIYYSDYYEAIVVLSTYPEETSMIAYNLDNWEIVDYYTIERPGETCLLQIGDSVITSSGFMYTKLYENAANLETCWDSGWDISYDDYLARIDLATHETDVIEFNHEGRVLDIAVKEGTPDVVYLLTSNDEIIVIEM